jgi:hypothetical protein
MEGYWTKYGFTEKPKTLEEALRLLELMEKEKEKEGSGPVRQNGGYKKRKHTKKQKRRSNSSTRRR